MNRLNSVSTHDPLPRRQSYTVWNFNNKILNNTVFSRRGLVNLGNTCYMNSVMQVLNATALANTFLANEYMDQLPNKEGKYSRVVNAFAYIIRELRRVGCDFAVSCSPFKKAIGDIYEPFDNSRQQDANEFLRVLLDALHTGMNVNANNKTPLEEIDNTKGTDDALARAYWWQYAQRNSSFIVDTCGFQERSLLTCPQCGYQTRSFSATFGVEIPIPNLGTSQNIENCLTHYCRQEVLDNSSMYLCAGCKKKVNATKQLQFHTTPQVLFITLKRFRTYGDFSTAAKVNDPILFGEHLDLKPFMSSEFSKTKYRLVGVVNHQGNMHGGHYTADAVGEDGAWFRFSDDVVQYATQPDACLAYILCYQRLQ
ncbi:ubiquitin thiolesterase [Strigomonas culicis]|uniref:ubiquitinyl hydrolase 1 n=1 Tax=Strigomonas culicis TaxID=28005 RepID=S9TPD1_9TRYP|nr:ubiquitin thiolesterase [Strigomonas culicis]|eukprot:EPY18313.1 ubiquitin thiolesterase [Strigomonas culicis]